MWKQRLWLGSCLGAGLFVGLLIAGTIQLRTLPELDLSVSGKTLRSAETATAPAEASPTRERERAWIRDEARRLVDDYMAEVWTELEIDAGEAEYAPEVRFLIDATDSAKWVTMSSARVPCASVDHYLKTRNDLEAGTPDRCKRWLRAAKEIIQANGHEDLSPQDLLTELDADQSVRVLLLFAGWQAGSAPDGEPKLIEARAAYVYPQRDFVAQRDLAQNTVFRTMKLGPYSSR